MRAGVGVAPAMGRGQGRRGESSAASRRPGSAAGLSLRAAPSRVPLSAGTVLGLQRSAGNSAVATLVQRQTEPAVGLVSERFKSSGKLQACFADRDRLRAGDPDRDAVKRVQGALLELATTTGRPYDLGPSGADGAYGPKTEAAVKQFKNDENLGFTQFGDVGPGTMRRLDQIFKGGGGDGPDPVAPEPLIEDSAPGEQVGPTPPEAEPPEKMPAFDDDKAPPIAASVQDLVSGVGGPGSSLRALAGPLADTKSFGVTAGSGSKELDDAIEQAVKKGMAESFKTKVNAIWAELRGQVTSLFTRLKDLVKKAVRIGVNALANAIAFALGGPVGVAVVSVFRRAWSAISKWFRGENDDPINMLADKVSRLVVVYIERLEQLAQHAITAARDSIEGLETTKRINKSVQELDAFLRGIARSKVVENVRRIFGGYESVVRGLRENLAKIGVKLADVPVIGQVDSVAKAVNEALDPSVSPVDVKG